MICIRKGRTHEEYIAEVAEKNKNVEVVGKYVNSTTKILHRCKICGKEWMVKPPNILRGYGCQSCGNKGSQEERRLNNDKFVSKIHRINPNITINTSYNGLDQNYNCSCKICGHIWTSKGNSLYHGANCPNCISTKNTITNEEYQKRIFNIHNGNIIPLENYTGRENKLKHKCMTCGHIWETTPGSIYENGCPNCGRLQASQKNTLSKELFRDRIDALRDDIELLSDYVNSDTKILIRCKQCGLEWEMSPGHILNNRGCPHCKKSNGEFFIGKYLNNAKLTFIPQKWFPELKGTGKWIFDI